MFINTSKKELLAGNDLIAHFNHELWYPAIEGGTSSGHTRGEPFDTKEECLSDCKMRNAKSKKLSFAWPTNPNERWVVHTRLKGLEWKFHEKWDWLMPVLSKIEGYGYIVTIEGKMESANCWINTNDKLKEPVGYGFSTSKIEAVWCAVVSFIEWYNKPKL